LLYSQEGLVPLTGLHTREVSRKVRNVIVRVRVRLIPLVPLILSDVVLPQKRTKSRQAILIHILVQGALGDNRLYRDWNRIRSSPIACSDCFGEFVARDVYADGYIGAESQAGLADLAKDFISIINEELMERCGITDSIGTTL
jgi:hypothetical protein